MRRNHTLNRKRKYHANQLDCARNRNHVEILHLLHVIVELPKEQNKEIKRNENFIDFISEI